MAKYSKTDYSRALNSIFQTEIKWEKLSTKDLETWYKIASDAQNLGKRIAIWEFKNRAQQRASEVIDQFGGLAKQNLFGA